MLLRSLGCVLYEMIHLKKAFPSGQESSPGLPDLGSHRIFTPILKELVLFYKIVVFFYQNLIQ